MEGPTALAARCDALLLAESDADSAVLQQIRAWLQDLRELAAAAATPRRSAGAAARLACQGELESRSPAAASLPAE